MTERERGYLRRLEERQAILALKRQIAFGLIVGALLALVGAQRCYLVLGASQAAWEPVMWAGFSVLALTLLLPSLWTWPEKALRLATGAVGKLVLQALLCLVYWAAFWPFGLILRVLKGRHPIYEWDERAPEDAEGWVDKQVFLDEGSSREARLRRLGAVGSALGVLAFFLRRGHAFLIPALLLLLVLALFFFFLQTSVLAPFIYTLF